MAGPLEDDEVERLRRVAFSRGGTAEDLRRLAELERPVVPGDHEPPPDADSEPDPAGPESPAGHPSPPSRRPVVIAAIAGILVGALVTWAVVQLSARDASAPPAPSALAVFDREPTADDDPAALGVPLDAFVPAYLDDLDLRRLGTHDGYAGYALRGSSIRMTQICLLVQDGTATTTATVCAALDDFAERGLTVGIAALTFRWGPDGTELWVEADAG